MWSRYSTEMSVRPSSQSELSINQEVKSNVTLYSISFTSSLQMKTNHSCMPRTQHNETWQRLTIKATKMPTKMKYAYEVCLSLQKCHATPTIRPIFVAMYYQPCGLRFKNHEIFIPWINVASFFENDTKSLISLKETFKSYGLRYHLSRCTCN